MFFWNKVHEIYFSPPTSAIVKNVESFSFMSPVCDIKQR
jgi:hypothetical protein